jgi:hypothetical protein
MVERNLSVGLKLDEIFEYLSSLAILELLPAYSLGRVCIYNVASAQRGKVKVNL